MRKKILSMALVLAMVFSLLPMTALAANGVMGTWYFRDAELNGKTEELSGELSKITATLGLTEAQMQAYYEATGKGTDFTPEVTGDTVTAYLIPGDNVEETGWDTTGIAAQLKKEYEVNDDTNEEEIAAGDYLVIAIVNGADTTYFASKIVVEEVVLSNDASLTAMTVKGETGHPVANNSVEIAEKDASNANLVKLESENKAINWIDYGEAVGDGKTEFTPAAKATVDVRIVDGLIVGRKQDVAGAFENGSSLNEGHKTDPFAVPEEGGEVWIVAKVTAEDGVTVNYYVFLVNVAPKINAGEIQAIKLAKSQDKQGKDSTETISLPVAAEEDNGILFAGNLAGGTEAAPAKLTAEVPYSIFDTNKFINVQVKNLDVEIDTTGDLMSIYTAVDDKDADVKDIQFRKLEGNPSSNKLTIPDVDFSNSKALYIRTTETVTNGDTEETVTKYYKLVVKQGAARSDATIWTGIVGVDAKYSLTGLIEGDVLEVGTYKDIAKLTATVPYPNPKEEKYVDGQEWSVYNRKADVTLIADLGVTAKYFTETRAQSYLNDGDFDNAKPVTDVTYDTEYGYTRLTFGKGVITYETRWIYIQLVAEDGSESIYELKVDMADAGTEAELVEVIPTQNGRPLDEGSYTVSGLDVAPSKDAKSPTPLVVTIPTGSNSENLSAYLSAKYGASIKFYETADFSRAGADEPGILTVNEPIYVKTTSNDGKVSYYYSLMFDISDSELPDKIVLTGCVEATLEDALAKIPYEGEVKVYTTDDVEVAAGENVGTGYYAVAGGNVIDIVVKGDVNSDAEIDIFDMSAIATGAEMDALEAEAADVNSDGSIDIFDLSAIAIANR